MLGGARGRAARGGRREDPAPDGVPARGRARRHRRRACWSARSASRWSGSPAPSRSRRPARASFRKDIQRSAILGELNELLPPSGPILNALVARRPVPAAFAGPEARRPAADTADPARPRRAARAARASSRCSAPPAGSRVQGSGWVAAPRPGRDERARRRGRRTTRRSRSPADHGSTPRPTAFDPHNDVAVLRVDGLGAPALRQDRETPASASRSRSSAFPRTAPTRAGRAGSARRGR